MAEQPMFNSLPNEDLPDVDPLTWDDSFAIARALIHHHGEIALEEVSLNMIYQWTVELPGFCDDRELANKEILMAIYQEWFEEANSL